MQHLSLDNTQQLFLELHATTRLRTMPAACSGVSPLLLRTLSGKLLIVKIQTLEKAFHQGAAECKHLLQMRFSLSRVFRA